MKAGPTLVSLLPVLKLHMMAEGYLGVSRYFYKLRRVIRIFHIHSAPTIQSKFLQFKISKGGMSCGRYCIFPVEIQDPVSTKY